MATDDEGFEAIEHALKRAAAALRDAQVPFLLGGSLASWARGGPETRHDLDLMIRPEDTETALQALVDVPVLGVIEPGVRSLATATQEGRVGVIGTVGTIASGAYQDAVARLADFLGASIPEKIADNLANGAFVHGAIAPVWRKLDLAKLHVTMTVNGTTLVDKVGGKPGDAPFVLLQWAANHLGSGEGLKAGDVITTGSWTGLHVAQPGDDIAVSFEGVGEVRLRCV